MANLVKSYHKTGNKSKATTFLGRLEETEGGAELAAGLKAEVTA